MTFALTFAGVVQTHLQRVLGEGYMDVQEQLALFYWMRLGAGAVAVIGVLMLIVSFIPFKSREKVTAQTMAAE